MPLLTLLAVLFLRGRQWSWWSMDGIPRPVVAREACRLSFTTLVLDLVEAASSWSSSLGGRGWGLYSSSR